MDFKKVLFVSGILLGSHIAPAFAYSNFESIQLERTINQLFTTEICSRCNLTSAILTGANLTGAILTGSRGSTFIGANLTDAIAENVTYLNDSFQGAILKNTDFANSDLAGSNFTNAVLTGTKFTGDNLENANFKGEDIIGANFTGADLLGANLTPTQIAELGNFTGTLPDGTVEVNGTLVPEPLNILGAIVGLGLIGGLKRKLK